MPSYEFSLRRRFVADHFHDLPGFVEARHGHNWELEATVLADAPDVEASLAECLDAWIRDIDYTLLNGLERLEGRNPTTECLAQWLLEDLQTAGLKPLRAKVREKANYWASCHLEAR